MVEHLTHQIQTGPATNTQEKAILLVEDDRTHRALMEQILEDSGFRTTPAENGVVALSKINTGMRFDLIIMDWDMPELNGLQTAKKIRMLELKENLPHTPIIAFTSNRSLGDRELCLAAGMDLYLPKDVWMPKWRTTLLSNLQALISGNLNTEDFESSMDTEEPQTELDLDALDMKALEQTASLLKSEFVITAEEYLEDAMAYINEIKDGIQNGDLEKTARSSHPLKSNSKGFGLVALSHIVEKINDKARSEQTDGLKELLTQLEQSFDSAEKNLRNFMKRAEYK